MLLLFLFLLMGSWFFSCFFLFVFSLFFFFFFFQAEDGIRDHCVTGVQTCALPISPQGRERPGPDSSPLLGLWHARPPECWDDRERGRRRASVRCKDNSMFSASELRGCDARHGGCFTPTEDHPGPPESARRPGPCSDERSGIRSGVQSPGR